MRLKLIACRKVYKPPAMIYHIPQVNGAMTQVITFQAMMIIGHQIHDCSTRVDN